MTKAYLSFKRVKDLPRLPLAGGIDITYRCNNNCRHCWLKTPDTAEERNKELSFREIKKIIDSGRDMGCRQWLISGGEPMFRPDFYEIFDYISSRSVSYSVNTNGTLITPKIARLMRRKGSKRIALYGATPDVHDRITRAPGSFEATMQGIAYLKEAGAGFIIMVVPMRDNYHQLKKMTRLAASLSRHYGIGPPWIYLSADRDEIRDKEIVQQRLLPCNAAELLVADGLSCTDDIENKGNSRDAFGVCISQGQKFCIDPYGKMSFCYYIKDPGLLYNLRKGSFKDCWERFIPSLIRKVKFDNEYLRNCGSCGLKQSCSWCPALAYLEHRRFSARVEYFCRVTAETERIRDGSARICRRYYRIADITIQLESKLPIAKNTFHPKFKLFEVSGPGGDNILIRHYFSLPDFNPADLGKEVYNAAPWAVYKKNGSLVYMVVSRQREDREVYRAAVFKNQGREILIYHKDSKNFLRGNQTALTLFPTDQIFLAQLLAHRQGFYLHSCGAEFCGKGLLFVGHSGAGKSTIARMLQYRGRILCDDRIIVRRRCDGFKIYGTWSHGEVEDVSAHGASLKAILFLKKSDCDRIRPLKDRREIIRRILACLIRPLFTREWWEGVLPVIDKLSEEIPCYVIEFSKRGRVADLVGKL